MLKQKIIISIIFLSFLLIGSQALASTTNGTIDPTSRYAWGENVGFIDFGSSSGNVHITDTALSGYAYGENIGFINLEGVTNDNEGNLSGYAWGGNVGFIDFSNTSIGTDGVFTGYAYGENIGFITFNTNDNNKVITDWRPKSSRSSGLSSSSRGSSGFRPILIANTDLIATPIITNSSCSVPSLTRLIKITTPKIKGDDVKSLQTYLNCHKYAEIDLVLDGIYGTKTKEAIIKFQLANQLIGDGIVGPITRAKIVVSSR